MTHGHMSSMVIMCHVELQAHKLAVLIRNMQDCLSCSEDHTSAMVAVHVLVCCCCTTCMLLHLHGVFDAT